MPKALTPRHGGKRRPNAGAASRPASRRDGRIAARDEANPGCVTPSPVWRRAVELLERGDAGAAVAEATKAKQLSSRSGAVREVLGLALYGQERWQEALAELKAYRRFSGRADQNHVIADCLRAVGKPQEAVPLAEEELRAKVPHEAKAEAVIVAALGAGRSGAVR